MLNAINNFFEEEKVRLPNLIPVGIGIGICIYFSLDNEPSLFWNAFACLLLAIIFAATKIYEYKKQIEPSAQKYLCDFVISGIFFVSFGFLIAQIRTASINTFMINENLEKPISFVATIESCEKTEKGLKFIVSKCKRKYDDKTHKLCKKFNKLHLIWIGEKARNSASDYVPGSQWLFRANLSPIRAKAFPGAYDFRKQQYFKRISARGFILKPPTLIKKCKQQTIGIWVEQLRHKIDKIIEKYLPKDTASIAKALTTGNTAGITKQIRSNFSNSGIAHILAISGLHIGIIGFFIFWIIRVVLCCISCIAKFYDVKKIAAVASWFAVLFYLQISGCSVSSVRAFIMHTIIIIAILLNRKAFTMRSVAIAATVIMLYSPEAIMFPSFQMSFGAVIAIISYAECNFGMPKFLKWLSEVIVVTIIASIPTSIISVSVFNQLTLNSVLANIFCIPLMTFFIMPVLMLSLPLMLIDCAQFTISLAGFGIKILMKIAEQVSQLPGSFFIMPTPTDFVFVMIVSSYLIFTLTNHRIRIIGFIGFCFGIILYFHQPISDIFISPNGKVIGIRTTEKCTCFNHLGYFRSMSNAWSKFVGSDIRKNFKSKECRKYIDQIAESTFIADIKGHKITITNDNRDDTKNNDIIVNKKNKNAELIYIQPKKTIAINTSKRPWD